MNVLWCWIVTSKKLRFQTISTLLQMLYSDPFTKLSLSVNCIFVLVLQSCFACTMHGELIFLWTLWVAYTLTVILALWFSEQSGCSVTVFSWTHQLWFLQALAFSVVIFPHSGGCIQLARMYLKCTHSPFQGTWQTTDDKATAKAGRTVKAKLQRAEACISPKHYFNLFYSLLPLHWAQYPVHV